LHPIETARLVLRPWTLTAADAGAFHRIWGNPQVIWWGHAVDADESLRVLERVVRRAEQMPPGLGWFAVVERAGERIVGGVMLQPASYLDDVELGYHVAHEAWGRGYATEASRGLLDYGLGELGLPRIVAAIHPDNFASRRVADKLGMVCEGQVMHATQLHDLYVTVSSPLAEPERGGR